MRSSFNSKLFYEPRFFELGSYKVQKLTKQARVEELLIVATIIEAFLASQVLLPL